MNYRDLAKKLNESGRELDKHITYLKEINDVLIEKTDDVQTALENLVGNSSLAVRITCSVCCTRERTHAFIPCGHGGMCERCATRGRTRNRCFICRAEIEGVMRVYL